MFTRKITNTITIVISLLLLTGCKTANSEQLAIAEKIMFSKPDSALKILQNIDTTTITTAKEQALYALLTTQAQDKNDINTTDHSLIEQAVNYYKDNQDKKRKMLSYYYMSRVLQNNGTYSEAIISLLKAENIALQMEDHFHLGLIYRAFFEIFYNIKNSVEALHYAELQHAEFKKTGKEIYINWALRDIAVAQIGAEQYENSLGVCHDIIEKELSRNNCDTNFINNIYKLQAISYFATKQYRKVIDTYNTILNNNTDLMNVAEYRNLGLAYKRIGQIDSAIHYMQIVNELDSTDQWLSYEIHKYLGNDKLALSALEIEQEYANSIIDLVKTQNITTLINKQKEYDKVIQEKEHQHRHLSYTAIIIILLLLIMLGFLIIKQKITAQKIEIENGMLQITNLSHILHIKETESNKIKEANIKLNKDYITLKEANINLKEANIRLFKDRFTVIDNLCSKYYELSGTEEEKMKKIYLNAKKQIIELTSNSETIKELEYNVNYFKDNLINKFKQEFPNISKEDYYLYLLWVSGFSTRAISVLTDKNINLTYKRKSRLKELISKSSSPNKELYLAQIN